MSNQINEKLLERAQECIEYSSSSAQRLDIRIEQAIDAGDLDEVERLVSICEGMMSQEEFEREAPDVY